MINLARRCPCAAFTGSYLTHMRFRMSISLRGAARACNISQEHYFRCWCRVFAAPASGASRELAKVDVNGTTNIWVKKWRGSSFLSRQSTGWSGGMPAPLLKSVAAKTFRIFLNVKDYSCGKKYKTMGRDYRCNRILHFFSGSTNQQRNRFTLCNVNRFRR